MHTQTPPKITVDPELAIFNILDVAADMTIALLMIFHPGVDHPESERDRTNTAFPARKSIGVPQLTT